MAQRKPTPTLSTLKRADIRTTHQQATLRPPQEVDVVSGSHEQGGFTEKKNEKTEKPQKINEF